MKKAKFNIVDLLVLLVLVAGAALLGMRMLGGQEAAPTGAEGERYQVTFYAACVSDAVVVSLQEDAEFFCEYTPVYAKTAKDVQTIGLGKLVSHGAGDAVCHTLSSDGRYVTTAKPGHASLTLVCEVQGSAEPTGLMVGGYALNVGHSLTIRGGGVELEAMVADIVPAA